MSEESKDGFAEILASEVVMVKCNGCGCDAPINKVYLPYVTSGIQSCRGCRSQGNLSES